jgi:DNA-binding HxlR family transcriptional regulator
MKWDEVSWILRGRLKRRVLIVLDKPKTASILAKELKTHRSTISDILIQMEEKGIVECLDPEQPYNRYYKLTSKGIDLHKEIEILN